MWTWEHCRISPCSFLAECCKRRLNLGSLVLQYFALFVCAFSCTVLFVSISQVIGCEELLINDLYSVGWGSKCCSTLNFLDHIIYQFTDDYKIHILLQTELNELQVMTLNRR